MIEETNTVEWPNGADFAPEFLYKEGQRGNAGDVRLPDYSKRLIIQAELAEVIEDSEQASAAR